MCTFDIRTNIGGYDSLLESMTAEGTKPRQGWQATPSYARHYRPYLVRTVTIRTRRKIAWERILLPFLAIACYATWQANATLSQQYNTDAQTIYRSLK